MSIDSISGALSSFVQKTASGGNGPTSTAPASALAEAQETAAVTAKEAAHGDRQAIAKLARLKKQAEENAPPKESGKGDALDHSA